MEESRRRSEVVGGTFAFLQTLHHLSQIALAAFRLSLTLHVRARAGILLGACLKHFQYVLFYASAQRLRHLSAQQG